jgi:SAM-dependent methyltransferase
MEPTEQNRRAWDEIHGRLAGRATRRLGLPQPVRHALADLNGKRVLNLQCGTGEAAAQLAELGATVTGVDLSPDALAFAREHWPTILWIEADSEELPRELRRGRFDLLYTGDGVVAAVQDLAGWANGIAAALDSGGDLLLYDDHPVTDCVDGLMHWRESYFDEGRRRLGQIVTAVAQAGLVVRALEEYPQQPGNARHQDARIPGTFLLYAQRP